MRSLRGIANICLVLEYLMLNNINLLIAEKMPELHWVIVMIFAILDRYLSRINSNTLF
jgi:hypothetical protein